MKEFKINAKLVFDPKNKTKKHSKQSSWKSVVLAKLDCDIDLYYTWFLKKRFGLDLNRSIRGAHVTIINDRLQDKKLYQEVKNHFNGKEIEISFLHDEIRTNKEHWWLRITSSDGMNIRTLCGLGDSFYPFHMTIGLVKDTKVAKENSARVLQDIMFYNL